MAATRNINQKLLSLYEEDDCGIDPRGELLFKRVFSGTVLVIVGLGLLLLTVELPARVIDRAGQRNATFLVEELPPPVKKPEPETVEDLTDQPELGHEETAPAIEPEVVEQPEPEPETKPRRVYGVRKVFARGLGSGGGGRAGIVSKRGNTLDKDPDNIEATEADLTGDLAPLSTVSKAPELKSRVRPQYTEEMIENRVSGLVRARLLVDSDGTVKDVQVLEDIKFGSRQAAIDAFLKLRFEPALRDGQPVAVWIIMKYRFSFQE